MAVTPGAADLHATSLVGSAISTCTVTGSGWVVETLPVFVCSSVVNHLAQTTMMPVSVFPHREKDKPRHNLAWRGLGRGDGGADGQKKAGLDDRVRQFHRFLHCSLFVKSGCQIGIIPDLAWSILIWVL